MPTIIYLENGEQYVVGNDALEVDTLVGGTGIENFKLTDGRLMRIRTKKICGYVDMEAPAVQVPVVPEDQLAIPEVPMEVQTVDAGTDVGV